MGAVTEPFRQAVYAASGFVSSFIPTIINDLARAMDDKERRTITTDSFLKSVLQRAQSRIPVLRERLEPQVTTLGEERERVGNVFEVMLDPTRPSPGVKAPLVEELRRLWDLGHKVTPSLLGDRKGFDVLTPEQNTELWKRAGQITNEKLSKRIILPDYPDLGDEEKAKIVKDFVAKSQISARAEMVLTLTRGLTQDALNQKLKKLKASGLMTKQVFDKYLELQTPTQ